MTVLDLTRDAPRSGRERLGDFAWLPRLADKVRAEHAGKGGEYVAYCPLSMGFLDRAGVTQEQFDSLIEQNASDEQILAYFNRHVPAEKRDAANHYVLEESRSHLDEQDKEEGRA